MSKAREWVKVAEAQEPHWLDGDRVTARVTTVGQLAITHRDVRVAFTFDEEAALSLARWILDTFEEAQP